jgi:hypothetical protein
MGAQRIRDNLIFGSHGILLVKSLTTVYKKYGQIARGPVKNRKAGGPPRCPASAKCPEKRYFIGGVCAKRPFGILCAFSKTDKLFFAENSKNIS